MGVVDKAEAAVMDGSKDLETRVLELTADGAFKGLLEHVKVDGLSTKGSLGNFLVSKGRVGNSKDQDSVAQVFA